MLVSEVRTVGLIDILSAESTSFAESSGGSSFLEPYEIENSGCAYSDLGQSWGTVDFVCAS